METNTMITEGQAAARAAASAAKTDTRSTGAKALDKPLTPKQQEAAAKQAAADAERAARTEDEKRSEAKANKAAKISASRDAVRTAYDDAMAAREALKAANGLWRPVVETLLCWHYFCSLKPAKADKLSAARRATCDALKISTVNKAEDKYYNAMRGPLDRMLKLLSSTTESMADYYTDAVPGDEKITYAMFAALLPAYLKKAREQVNAAKDKAEKDAAAKLAADLLELEHFRSMRK